VRVELRGLTKRFGTARAVDGLVLDLAPGELVSLVGASGCGKTTTLRMIAGFERPDAGDIVFDGRRVNEVPARRRDVGIVFQSYALFPTMTVADNVAFGLRVARWPWATIRKRVAEMIQLTGLEGLEARHPNQLSGGQQQRVALARALARRPQMLLLDEPLSALDAKIRLRLRAELRAIQQDLAITTLYVTHDQEEALSIADRIAVMRDGRIEQVGRPADVYVGPRTEFVADFIGVSNRLACRVVSAVRGLVEWEGEPLRVHLDGVADGDAVVLVLRPEALRLAGGPVAVGDDNRLDGVLEVATFLGPVVRLEVNVRGRRVWVDVTRERARGLERRKPVGLTFGPTDASVIPLRGARGGQGDP
jgi:putative spermidine/putrescine transport system ATP-binding protein